MARVARGTLILVARLAAMVSIGLGSITVRVAGEAGEPAEVPRRVVTVRAGVPFAAMSAAVDREPLGVMIPARGRPSRGVVTGQALKWELRRCV